MTEVSREFLGFFHEGPVALHTSWKAPHLLMPSQWRLDFNIGICGAMNIQFIAAGCVVSVELTQLWSCGSEAAIDNMNQMGVLSNKTVFYLFTKTDGILNNILTPDL